MLQLTFALSAGEVEEDPSAGSVQYLVDEGRFVVRLRKRHAGEHFAGLELLGRLLAPPRPSHTSASLLRPSPHIECVAASGGGGGEDREHSPDAALAAALEERLHFEDFDWFIEQSPASPAAAPAEFRARQLCSPLTHGHKSTAPDVYEQPSRTPRPSSDARACAGTGAGAGEKADGDDGPPVDVEHVERTVSLLLQPPQYGFALRLRSRLLGALSSELRELIDLPDPDEVHCLLQYSIFQCRFRLRQPKILGYSTLNCEHELINYVSMSSNLFISDAGQRSRTTPARSRERAMGGRGAA